MRASCSSVVRPAARSPCSTSRTRSAGWSPGSNPSDCSTNLDDRVKRRVAHVACARTGEPAVRSSGEALVQHERKARLADAGLTADMDHLAFAANGLVPSVEEQLALSVATDQRHESASAATRFQSTAHRARPHDPMQHDRLGHALHRTRANLLHDEPTGNQTMRGCADHHFTGLGRRLHPRRDVRRLTQDHGVAPATRADGADHARPAVQPDPHRQAPTQIGDHAHDLQPGAHCLLG